MKKLLFNLLNKKTGLVSLISEKTGKLSFRRSIPVLIITAVVVPSVNINGLEWIHVVETAIAGLIYVVPEVLKKRTTRI